MKLVLYSPNFYPMVGGLENVVQLLAGALHERGHAVCVVTRTAAAEANSFSFPVMRTAGFWATYRAMRRADVVVQFNVSLKGVLPALLSGRPLVITHHGVYPAGGWRGRLKRWVARRLARANTGCSRFIAGHYRGGQWLPNPYDESVFRELPNIARSADLVFVGRLVSQKGLDVLLRALAILNRTGGAAPGLTVVGNGPERVALGQLTARLSLTPQVRFVGQQVGDALAGLLCAHAILVVPSRGEEGFGIVALEGIACGCFVIGSRAGGLPEAIGPGGVTFPVGDADALADAIQRALSAPTPTPAERVTEHLHQHARQAVADRFVTLLNQALT